MLFLLSIRSSCADETVPFVSQIVQVSYLANLVKTQTEISSRLNLLV
jgi:hypothetical protein